VTCKERQIVAIEQEKLERTTETLPPSPVPVSAIRGEACLVHIYPSGPTMGRRYRLADGPLLIGRASDCDLRVEDHSVSRRHARIELAAGSYVAIDLESTNGTLVNGIAAPRRPLADGDYLQVGNCIYRFLAGGNVEAEYHEEIYRLAIIDALTDIPNKRYLLEFLGRELSRSARHCRPLALVLFDIDRFKGINDERGHLCGDHVLRELAACVRPVVRTEELFARYGGEEFAVVLPECTRAGAATMAARLRALVEAHPFCFDGQPVPVTVSVGVADTSGQEISAEELIRRADEKLFEAKRGGRNRVAC
jgi:diguanylate cyclase (GGDEF)-like protein